ncbi:shikimate dehydrogenase [Lacihabitans sp. LS3-19]|uniref:shikimate dehydrogenase family protein n=1 Tax=Lacihabitans sp. LS3-19 TaxID=2487335 RepID=UPI0020CD70CA|nr:shikimate dehydrogenase [Lacihabitans sp. LS3-19]MCP9768041.1 shikimate dehydrogenase [Lacihabitans sp. LS3-19]
MKKYGLVGFPLSHSFSKKYFTEKFGELGLSQTHQYELFEMEDIKELKSLISKNEDLVGLNVTIPHKVDVMQFLTEVDPAAKRIGAVNVIKVAENKKLIGYNSDYFGFRKSLEEFLGNAKGIKALVMGNGGAAKAVCVALEDMEIPFELVSRRASEHTINYRKANELLAEYKLVINCTPLGTYPNVASFPDLDYETFTSNHFCFDLVYNPSETQFLQKAKANGAKTKNGYDMLVYQAEKSWEIWGE